MPGRARSVCFWATPSNRWAIRLAWLSFEDEHCTEEARKQPGRRVPPDNLEDDGHDKREVRALSWRWLGWQDPCSQQHDGEAAERGELAEEAGYRVFAKSEPRHEKACDKKDAGESQRDRGLRDKADDLGDHARLISPSRSPNMGCAGSKEASPQPGRIRSAADMQ